jgi:hypothetical protein
MVNVYSGADSCSEVLQTLAKNNERNVQHGSRKMACSETVYSLASLYSWEIIKVARQWLQYGRLPHTTPCHLVIKPCFGSGPDCDFQQGTCVLPTSVPPLRCDEGQTPREVQSVLHKE